MVSTNSTGFTLIEVLLAMVVSMIILGGAYMFFDSQQKQTTIQTNVSDVQQTLRAAMDFVSRDIRMAGYDPEISKKFGISDIRFHDYSANLSATGTSYIEFSWDQNGNGNLDSSETINYSLSNTSAVAPFALMYGTPLRAPLAGYVVALGFAYAIDTNGDGELDRDASNGNTVWYVDVGNDNDWDSLTVNQGAGTNTISDTGIPVNTKDIRSVRIWMLAQSQAPDPKYTDNNTYVIGPHISTPNNNFRHRLLERTVLCRNMGLNL